MSLKSSKVKSVNLMSLMMRKIGLGAFLSLFFLNFFDMTDPIVQGEGGNMYCVLSYNGDRGCVISLVLGGVLVLHKPSRGNVFWGE